MSRKPHGIVRTTSVILTVVVVSKLLGMIREMLLASRLGVNLEASAYSASFSLVFILTLLFQCFLQTAFLPIYSRARVQDGQAGADRYASGVLTFFGLAGLLVAALFYFAAPAVVSVYTPGFGPEGQALVVRLTRLMLPMFAAQVVSNLLTALLNANEDFVIPHIATMALSFALIPVLIAVRPGDPEKIVLLVSIATTASAVLEVLIQLPGAMRRMRFRPVLRPRDPLIRQTLLVAVPAVISTGSSELNQFFQKILTSALGDKEIAALTYGYKTYAIYVGLFILPITVILFSRLSARAADDDREGMLDTQRRYLETLLLVLIPMVTLSMILYRDIIRILYQRGAFTAEDTLLTGSAFLLYLPGLVGYAVKDIFSRFFFTLQDTRTPMLVGVGSLAVNVALNLALVGPLGIAGLALASSSTLLLSALALAIILRRKTGPLRLRPALGQTLRILAATAVGAGLSIAASRILADRTTLIRLVLAGAVPLAAILCTALALDVKSARWLARETLSMIRGRKER